MRFLHRVAALTFHDRVMDSEIWRDLEKELLLFQSKRNQLRCLGHVIKVL